MLLNFAKVPSTMNIDIHIIHNLMKHDAPAILFVIRSDLSRSFEIRQKSTCFKVVHIQNMKMYNHILLDWHFSTIEVFRSVNLQ